MYDSNSIYYNNLDNSLEPNNYNILILSENQCFIGYFNKVYHYNRINITNKTRVSLDFRVMTYSDYCKIQQKKSSVTCNLKFTKGNYYKII